jgi:hypothetical protein
MLQLYSFRRWLVNPTAAECVFTLRNSGAHCQIPENAMIRHVNYATSMGFSIALLARSTTMYQPALFILASMTNPRGGTVFTVGYQEHIIYGAPDSVFFSCTLASRELGPTI